MAKVPILLPSLETFWVVFTGPLDEDDRIRICRKILACIPNQSAENTGETVVYGTMLVRRGGIEVNIVFEKGDPEDYADARSETFPVSPYSALLVSGVTDVVQLSRSQEE
jgi:hypothetical protein